MSTALAVKPTSSAASALDKLFDFEASHARATARLRKALDGNGATAADLETVARTGHMQRIFVAADVRTNWSGGWEEFAGSARGNIQYVAGADLETVARRSFDEFAGRQVHADKVVGLLEASPTEGFAAERKIPLGAIPLSFASQRNCRGCGGAGECKCANIFCFFGKVNCTACNGTQVIYHHSGKSRCNLCIYGKVNCPHCAGTTRIGCGDCKTTGIFTTLWTAAVHAEVEYRIHTPEGHNESWTSSLTKSGHAWLADAGFVSKPQVKKRDGGASVGWTVDVPVLGQTFRIGQKDYKAQYVGRRERMWSLPRFLDDTLGSAVRTIREARSAQAFAIAAQYPVFARVRHGVLKAKSEDADVVRLFEAAISTEVVAKVRARLESGRDEIARSTISTVWKYAGVALAAGSLIALASGQFGTLFGAMLPELKRPGSEVAVAAAGGLLLAALLGATWFLAGIAGRSAVRTVLETKADRLPDQGRIPMYACLATVFVYAAGAYMIVPGKASPNPRTAAVSASSRLPDVKPPTIPPFYR